MFDYNWLYGISIKELIEIVCLVLAINNLVIGVYLYALYKQMLEEEE